jgi:hypothetical protein
MYALPEFEVVRVHPEDDRRSALFDPDRRFALGWDQLGWHPLDANHDEYYTICADGLELARLHLNRRTGFVSDWNAVPDLGASPLRIQLIEVAADSRGHGLGTAIVGKVQVQYPHSRLIALSRKDATGFWDSLHGWARHDHVTDGRRQPLYVGPAVNAASR